MAAFDIYSNSMSSFTRMFREHLKLTDQSQIELLFQTMLEKESRNLESVRHWNAFARLCRELVRMHNYSLILRFMYGIFLHHEEYDMAQFHEKLSEIKLEEGYTLADLCQDFYLDICDKEEFMDPIPENVDLYHQFPKELQLGHDGGPEMCITLPETISRRVYHRPLTIDTLTTQDLDELVELARQQTVAEHESSLAYAEKHNQEADETNQRLGKPVCAYLVSYPLDTFKQNIAIPGLLLPFFAAAELTGRRDIGYHILESHVLPYLAIVPWERSRLSQVSKLAVTTALYADYLQAMIWREFPRIEDSHIAYTDEAYLNQEFYYEALGKTGSHISFRYANVPLTIYCRRHLPLAKLWAAVMHTGCRQLRSVMPERAYSFHMFLVPYLLHFGGEENAACDFLLHHYNDMSLYEKRKPQAQILLIRSILSATRAEAANVLYGFYNYELDRVQREHSDILMRITRIVGFLLESRTHIQKANEYYLKENISWFDILFRDGRIDGLLTRIQEKLQIGDLPNYPDFRTLVRVLEAFSYPGGIHLGMLNIPNYDNYDKLDHAIPYDFVEWGQGYVSQISEIHQHYASVIQAETRRNINVHLQNHIFNLQRSMVSDSLDRVTAMKKQLPKNMTPEEEEQAVAEIQQITDNLMSMLQSSTLGRAEIDQYVTSLHTKFTATYLADSGMDLMHKLPRNTRTEVHNYLVTSNLVFRMLSARNDSELDYSAALISLTKALELVMQQIYAGMQVDYNTATKSAKELFFNRNGSRQPKLALGAYIALLQSDQYDRWGGKEVIDLSILEKFKSIDLHVRTTENGFMTDKMVHFTGNADKNRKYLIQALDHIRANYRNRAAHQEIVTMDEVNACHQLLIDGQNLLWILLAILR